MRVAQIVSERWLDQERQALQSMSMGLYDQQVEVLFVLPETVGLEPLIMTSRQIFYRPALWRWVQDLRLGALADPMADANVDLIHAVDGSLQQAALKLGQQLDLPVVVSVWSAGEVHQLRKHDSQVHAAYAPASTTLLKMCKTKLGAGPIIQHVPPGVYSPDPQKIRPPLQSEDRVISCAVLGDGRPDAHYDRLMDGMARAKARLGGAVYFFYTFSASQHGLWQMAKRKGLLEQVNLVRVNEANRRLLPDADVLILPQPSGAIHTIVLEAMAAGRPVVATVDAVLGDFLNDRTARLLEEQPTPDEWDDCLSDLANEPDLFLSKGTQASKFVREHFSVYNQINHLIDLYRRVAAPPIPFTPSS
ncbi:MAG: glycosyltransferase family 4 protein [Phycisphaeraceae bacterium]|nr:glycosyltransferase family 4 protein [Phycisphaeraceae bacterium]